MQAVVVGVQGLFYLWVQGDKAILCLHLANFIYLYLLSRPLNFIDVSNKVLTVYNVLPTFPLTNFF